MRALLLVFALLLAGCPASGSLGGPLLANDDDAANDDDLANDDDAVANDDDDDATSDDDDSTVQGPERFDVGLDELLADTFRIDISTIDIGLDYTPLAPTMLGEATLTFTMRPGQTVPLVHFSPVAAIGLDALATVTLDGEDLDPTDPADLLSTTVAGSPQRVVEIQRTVDPSVEHSLTVTWEAVAWWDDIAPGWLFTDVSDIAGEGNEILFPTINSPDELSRHTIEMRVHSAEPYRVLGSGLVTQQATANGVQTWSLDTEREVSSITVLLVAMPADEVIYEERTVAGVPVRIAAITEAWEVDQAFDDTEEVLDLLIDDFGALPMPRGLSILLHDDYGGGMEYFGGTITDGWAIPHEIAHMYFGTSTVARTWRDSWWDEAIDIWYLWPSWFDPVGEGFGSDIVSGRNPITPAFDTRAYDEGAAVFDLVADRVGGRAALVEALAVIRAEHAFAPFTTGQLIGFLEAETGVDLTDEFGRWVYGE